MSSEVHDQIRDKFSEVFKRESAINQAHPFEAFAILFLLVVWPLMETQQHQEVHLTIRVLLLSSLMGILKKSKKKIQIHGNVVMYLGIFIQILSSILYIYHKQSNEHCQNYLVTVGFLLFICNRFSLTNVRIISYSISLFSLIIQVLLQSQIFIILKYCTLAIIGIEGSIWKMHYWNKEQNKKLYDFGRELEYLKGDYIEQINKINEKVESPIQEQISSRANDLLRKLRLLKYQQLLIKSNNIQKGITRKPNKLNSEIHKNSFSARQLPDQHEDDRSSIEESLIEDVDKQNNNQDNNDINNNNPPIFIRKSYRMMTSATDQMQYRNNENSQSASFQEKNQEEVQITIEDIDDLLNLLSSKKDTIWLPKFLRSNQLINEQEGFTIDAKQFLLSHFTQRQPSFQFIDVVDDFDSDDIFDEIDFNIDYLQYWKLQDNIQTRVFIETSINLFKRFRIAQTLKIQKQDMIGDFALKLFMQYHNNLYHNSLHALDVANSTAFFLKNGLNEQLDEFEQACLIVSSLAHDLGHPGLNNGFMTTNKCKLALLYNDQSVLENYHSFLLFQILQQEQFNLIQNLGLPEQKGFRKYCLNLILDTDLTKHFQLMNRFQNYLDLSESQVNDKTLVMSICIKCADVGHGAKQLKMHKQWSRRIIEEFFLQGDLEDYLKVPISPMCDRKQSVVKSQEGFLKAIVLPMFNAFANLLQNEKVNSICISQIHENLQYWQQQINDEEFMMETYVESSGVENLKKFLNQPLQLNL
ncbi:unnamed protein product [Paramecium primaurelia]|uniref:Phosphodiesterase n=1 Tax=Paramecium primaurelia TaxID=5886 RepID=A0A8S1N5J6_PARPR|nr:unnamed protein product [Paramecium primaurelia]